jgi:5-methylcytosine-specific restriction endonuclease McrBC regulatory subunit McrC
MYTVNILRKTKETQLKKLYIDIEYLNNGIKVATETREFSIDATLNQVKRYALNEVKRYETSDANTALIVEGILDLSTVVDVAPTQAEIDKNVWFRQFNRLEQLTKLQTLGALRPALVTDLDALKATVAADFKKAYIADM